MNGENDLPVEAYWPVKVSAVDRAKLRLMDDEQFAQLKRLVRLREYRHTKSSKHAAAVVRRLEFRRRPARRTTFSKAALLAKRQECEILSTFVPDRNSRWRKMSRRKHGQAIDVQDFSFIDNPINTFETLRRIALGECEMYGFYIDFLDDFVLDIGPYLVFGIMRQNMAPVTSGGVLSAPTQKVLKAVGLHQFLKMKLLGSGSLDDVYPLPVKYRRKSGTTQSRTPALEPTSVEKQADDTAANVNVWLDKLSPKEELTDYGLGQIKSIVGELLNNAERHGRIGGDGEWVTAGFMAQRTVEIEGVERLIHICHLGFYNPGRSISDSIVEAPQSILDQISRYIELHRGKGLSRETLATVFALQDGISRVQQGDGQPTGGTGLMDVVQFANSVGRTKLIDYTPKVAIVSGTSYVRFDTPYGEGVETDNRRLQWFNSQNSATSPPDPEHVMDLPSAFPGTLITLRFVLDEQFEKSEHVDVE